MPTHPLQLEPYNVMFKAMSNIIAQWYDMRNKYIVNAMHFFNRNNDLCFDVYHKGLLWNKMCY